MSRSKLPSEIFSVQFLVLMSYSSIAFLTLLPLYLKHLGGGPKEIGFFISLFSFASLFSRPIGGWLVTRFHPKKILVSGLFLLLIATITYLFIRRLDWSLGLVRIVHGVGFSIFIIAGLLIVVLKTGTKEAAYAIGVVSTGFMLPLLVIPFLGEKIIEKFGYFVFFMAAVSLALIPFFYALFAKFSLPVESGYSSRKGLSYFTLLKEGRIIIIFLLTFLFEVALSSGLAFVPLLAHTGTSMKAGFYFTFLGLTAVILRLYGGKYLPLWGSEKLVLPAFFFLSGGGILTSLAFSNAFLASSAVVWGIGVGILYPHMSALSVERVSPENKGKVLSLFAASVDMGFAFGPLSFGLVSQLFGLRKAFVFLSFFIIVASSLLIAVYARIKKVKEI